jgi:NADH-quinone oxidoreductase subunit N
MPIDYLEILKLAAPETILVLTVLAVLGADLVLMRGKARAERLVFGATAAGLGCVAAIAWMFGFEVQGNIMQGMLVVDPLIRLVKASILTLSIFTIAISVQSRFTAHIGEYLALILLATIGMMFMVSSEELLVIFVALELTSLCLYVLTAFNKQSLKSAEAALKYFLFGSMSAAFTLFGLSLIYGLSGSTNLVQISAALQGQPLHPLLIVAMVMTVAGFGFKVAAAPFHLWAPDAYQGAPTPSAALIASGSKVASFFLFAKIMIIGFGGLEGSGDWGRFAPGWVLLLVIVAALSLVLGNLSALVQSNVKRLLAYSAIAHAGYALLGLISQSQMGVAALLYYVVTYGLTVLGAFGVVHLVEQEAGSAELESFAGLSRRSPLLSFCMLIFMLSLAGIPPLAGFFGKFYLFAAALDGGQKLGLIWLVVLAIGLSAVSLYYYLLVLKQIYVAAAPDREARTKTPANALAAVSALAVAVIVLGCAPNLLVGRLLESIRLAGFP